MRHRVRGRKLGRSTEHRLAMLRNLSSALFDREKITTTLSKAKELRPFAEKLVTLSKKETLHARRRVMRHIHDRKVASKLFEVLSARYSQRPGGYTRIMKLGPRRGDNAEMAIIELVAAETAGDTQVKKPTRKKASRKKRVAAKVPGKVEAKKAKKAKKTTSGKSEAESEGPAAKGKRRAKKKVTKKAAKTKAGKATKKKASSRP